MTSTISANKTPRNWLTPRAALQVAWGGAGLVIGLRATGIWNFESASRFFPPCVFHLVTGVDCPGCGMTRAFLRLSHGDISGAFDFHPFSPILALLLLLIAWGPKTFWVWLQTSSTARYGSMVAAALLISWWSWAKLLPVVTGTVA